MNARSIPAFAVIAGVAAALPFLAPQQNAGQPQLQRLYDIEVGLLQRPDDEALLRAKVSFYRDAGLALNALTICRASRLPSLPPVCDQPLLNALVNETNAQRAAQLLARNDARAFAVIIGISNYQKGRMPQLTGAAADAQSFADLIRNPRPGGLRPGDVFVLTDKSATAARIREALETVLTKAGPRDTVHIFASAHGVTSASGQDGYLMAYDSDPQELHATAYRLSELRSLIQKRSSSVSQVVLYADLCRMAPFQNHANLIQVALRGLDTPGARFGGMLAGSSSAPTLQTTAGGPHGVFSYYLLEAFKDAARNNKDLTIAELFQYVYTKVLEETRKKQRPAPVGTLSARSRVAAARPWLYRNRSKAPVVLGFGFLPEMPFEQPPQEETLVEPGVSFDIASGPEEQGQQVILRYLQGNEEPLSKGDFDQGATWFRLAREIKASDRVLAREKFCLGRSATFDAHYDEAFRLLGEAIKLEPEAAYAYNALGIAQLLNAQTADAIASFNQAIARAPFWIYPRHNLALARAEGGEYRAAEDAFRAALDKDPSRAHLHYSLGLLYQRLSRVKDAAAEYRRALSLDEGQADAHTGLGAILALQGKTGKAEQEYKRALQLNPKSVAARHDLGLVLLPRNPAAAIDNWRENLALDPKFTPSRLSLARALRAADQLDESAAEYRKLLDTRPKLAEARFELARVLRDLNHRPDAAAELETLIAAEPDNFNYRKEYGDLLVDEGKSSAARTQFEAALRVAPDRSRRHEIQAQLKRLATASAIQN